MSRPGGLTQAIALEGSHVLFGTGAYFGVLEITDPDAPIEIGGTEALSHFVEGIAVSGTLACAAVGTAGLQIVDLADPTQPIVVGSWDSPGYAEDVAMSGSYAFLADGPAGLRVIDLSDPTNPVEVSTAYPLSYVFDVAIESNYAYLAAAGAGLLVVDISDPTSVTEHGSLDTPGYAYGVAVNSNTVCIADGWEGLRTILVFDPANPVESGSFATDGQAFGVEVVGTTAYVADAHNGLVLVDVSDLSSPTAIGTYSMDDAHASAVAVSGDRAYVVDRNHGLHLVDISNPVSPTQILAISQLSEAIDVKIQGDYAYVASNGLRVVDLTDPDRPIVVGAVDIFGTTAGVAVEGNYAYIPVTAIGLYVIDISDPTNPWQAAFFAQPLGSYRDIALLNGFAYIADEWGMEIVDVTDPTAPRSAGLISFQSDSTLWAATLAADVSGDYAYVTGDGGMRIVDVSDASSPTLVSVYNPNSSYTDVAVSGTRVFLTGDGRGVEIVDVSTPSSPQSLGIYDGPGASERVNVSGSIAYVAFANRGLHAVDVSDPANPVLSFSQETPGRAYNSAGAGTLRCVADGDGGLFVFSTSGPAKVSVAPSIGSVKHRSSKSNRHYYPPRPPARKSTTVHAASLAGNSGTIQTVTSAADSGPGTLRNALLNAGAGNTIVFDVSVFPPATPVTISLSSQLPPLTQGGLLLDASNAGVIIEGSGIPGAGTIGISISSDGNVVRGLQVMGFGNAGVQICCAARNNTIGGDRSVGSGPAGQGNVLSGNTLFGLIIHDVGTMDNLVIGNLIGTDTAGITAIPNGFDGVNIANRASNNTVGSLVAGERNIISGNTVSGVGFGEDGTHSNRILGNLIGTDITGTVALGNGASGVLIETGSSRMTIEQNVISGNRWGIIISDPRSSYNVIIGNLIGTDITGTKNLGNMFSGISVGFGGTRYNRIGGTTPADRNVISGNDPGIELHGAEGGNLILGNYIGTDINGTAAIPNRQGIVVVDGASRNLIGGATDSERNVISGNTDVGILLGTVDRNFIGNNWIGTDVDGQTALPNGNDGLLVSGGHFNTIQANLCSSNRGAGIAFVQSGQFNFVRANRIGIAADGVTALPNSGSGVRCDAESNRIGGTGSNDGNVIALNSAYGIHVGGFAGNTISGNSIYDNSLAGIVWFAGAGTESPAPVITIANSTTVTGTANPGVRIEVFSDSANEGRVFEGTSLADSSGDWSWNGNPAGPNVTATATDGSGTTSVFSMPIPVN